MGGDVLPGLPAALTANGSGISFDFQFSPLGTHYLIEVAVDGFATTEDNALVMDGAGLMVGGALVREGTPVPPAAGGIGGENWDNFDEVDVTESGHVMFVGDTDGDTLTDEILVLDGAIAYREGDTVDGLVLTGSIQGAALNEAGQVVFVWEVDTAMGPTEALFVDDRCRLKVGDEIDWDDDGMPDPGLRPGGLRGDEPDRADGERPRVSHRRRGHRRRGPGRGSALRQLGFDRLELLHLDRELDRRCLRALRVRNRQHRGERRRSLREQPAGAARDLHRGSRAGADPLLQRVPLRGDGPGSSASQR